MNFLAGILLIYLPKEEDAYSALVLLMQHRSLRELYKEDLGMLQVRRSCPSNCSVQLTGTWATPSLRLPRGSTLDHARIIYQLPSPVSLRSVPHKCRKALNRAWCSEGALATAGVRLAGHR